MTEYNEWQPVFRQVIVRALCDALGFTNLTSDRNEHKRAVNSARAWFIEGTEKDFVALCDLADLDSRQVRAVAMALIHAKSSGDHSSVPAFWKHVFRGKRVPNLTNIERALDKVKEAA